MTLQRTRDPLHPCSPVAEAIGLISVDGVAEAIDRAVKTIYDMADQETDASPNIRQAKAIDEACMKQHGVAPFAKYFERLRASNVEENEAVFAAAARGVKEAGIFLVDYLKAQDPGSECGQSISPNELRNLIKTVETAQVEFEHAIGALLKMKG